MDSYIQFESTECGIPALQIRGRCFVMTHTEEQEGCHICGKKCGMEISRAEVLSRDYDFCLEVGFRAEIKGEIIALTAFIYLIIRSYLRKRTGRHCTSTSAGIPAVKAEERREADCPW